MIVYLEGEIIKKTPAFIILKTYGVGYGINLSLLSAARINKGDKVALLITQIIKEDSNKLYGFLDESEQILFEALIKVNGIGATSAMALLSSMDVASLQSAIINENAKALCKAPGIGAKSASRLILELKDKIIKLGISAENNYYYEASEALLALGFKQEAVIKALKDINANSVSEVIKLALKKLS